MEEVKPAEAADPAEVVEISDETAPALEQEVVDEMVAEADDEPRSPRHRGGPPPAGCG